MDGEAGWWTTSGNIGLPPLAMVMGVGRQQQALWCEIIIYDKKNDKVIIGLCYDSPSNYEEKVIRYMVTYRKQQG